MANRVAVRDEKARKLWASQKTRCDCCGLPVSRIPFPGAQVHHIVRRNRSDEPCNFLLICGFPCHVLMDVGNRVPDGKSGYLDALSQAQQLTLKLERASDEYDYERLCVIKGERLDDPEPLPQWVIESWERWTNR